MDELKALLGDSYKEGMTVEEVGEFFKGKNFKDLSSGQYVDKNKFDSKVDELTKALNEKTNELNSKLTDDEKSQQASAEQQKEIERLKSLLSENKIDSNKVAVNGILSNVKNDLEIKDGDEHFTKFLESIVSEDSAKSSEIANYVSELVKKSYEKGKTDATKDSMGNFGKSKNGGGDNKGQNEIGEIGKRIAKNNTVKKTEYDYFAKKK